MFRMITEEQTDTDTPSSFTSVENDNITEEMTTVTIEDEYSRAREEGNTEDEETRYSLSDKNIHLIRTHTENPKAYIQNRISLKDEFNSEISGDDIEVVTDTSNIFEGSLTHDLKEDNVSVKDNLRVPTPISSQSANLQNLKAFITQERRKQRNREASRRYREKARKNPELLRKLRDQSNARQKKYYARLRMKKIEESCQRKAERINPEEVLFVS